jgi:hypothetical protein
MNARKGFTDRLLTRIFDIHDCVRDTGGYRVMVELGALLALILLFALPAVIW